MDSADIGILIVDDEPAVRDSLHSWFEKDGYRTGKAADATEALKKLSSGTWHIVLLDIKMPGINGMDLQKRIKQNDPDIIVIMITAYASVDTAVEALKRGAFDYVSKPIDPEELSKVVLKAADHLRLRHKDQNLAGGLSPSERLIGESPQMKKVLRLIGAVSSTDTTVLIRGGRGTGKELVARLIHANSLRKFFPLVPVSCGALGASLLRSELFGHEKGSLMGVQQGREGKLKTAGGGTLFLDDIDAIDARMQEDILRVIETKQFTPPGGNQAVPVDSRIICATSQDLERRVGDGLFMEELYYRINAFQIEIPPLRDRRTDVSLLADFFIQVNAAKFNRGTVRFSKAAMAALMVYDWPGNVRELENSVERAIAVSTGPTIELQDLPRQIAGWGKHTVDDSLVAVEKAHIAEVLEKTSWNISRAAKRLGVDRATLYSKIKKYKIEK